MYDSNTAPTSSPTTLRIDTVIAADDPAVSALMDAMTRIFRSGNDSLVGQTVVKAVQAGSVERCEVSIGCSYGVWGYAILIPNAWHSPEQVAVMLRADHAVTTFAAALRSSSSSPHP